MAALVSPPSSPLLAPHSADRQRPRLCQALLSDELTPCDARNTSGRFCTIHGKEYKALTKAYKDASELASALRVPAALGERQIRALRTVAEVDEAIAAADAWHAAVSDEMRGRRAHHTRFFDTKDEGHERRLECLAKEKTRAERLIDRLAEKRLYVSSAKDKHRRRRSKSSVSVGAITAPGFGATPRPRSVSVQSEQREVPVPPSRRAPVPVSPTTEHVPHATRPTTALQRLVQELQRERELAASIPAAHAGPLLPTHTTYPYHAPLPPLESSSAQSSSVPVSRLATAPDSSTSASALHAARLTSALQVLAQELQRERELATHVRVKHARADPLLPTHIPHRVPLPPSNSYSAQSSTRPLITVPGPRYGYGAIINCVEGDGGDKRGRSCSFFQNLLKGVLLVTPLVWLGYLLLR